MKHSQLLSAIVGWSVLLAAGHAAAAYESLGVTRSAVETMLKSEGLNPKPNTYPDHEGEKVTSMNVFNPQIYVQLFGPDDGLTTIEVTIRPSADADDAYWQTYVCLWVLNTVFPEWDNREEWWARTIMNLMRFGDADIIEFERSDRIIQTAFLKGNLILLSVSGKKIE